MMGKLANIAADMNRMDKVQEGLLKALTSGDPIQVNRKNKDPITMRPTARLIFATNTMPPITDRSEGVWRRMIAMPFRQQFDVHRRDRQRGQRLLEELPGIYNWALEGARRLYTRERFTDCAVCRGCLDEHQFSSDPFRQFADQELELNAGGQIRKEDAYQRYREFCDANGRHPKNSVEFGRQMFALHGVSEGRMSVGNRQRTYKGVHLACRGFGISPAAPTRSRPESCDARRPRCSLSEA
jgi:putative DNA primase/helicase